MSDDLPNRQTIRLPGYDYSQNGYYFVTICAQNHENIFGEIVDGKMVLNDVGKIMERWVCGIVKKFSNTKIDICQIMPNHVHIIIIIVGAGFPRPHQTPNKLPTLGQIIAYFKYQSSKSIRINMNENKNISGAETVPLHVRFRPLKIFQRNYHEHIIRSAREYKQIYYYIQNNPQNWGNDDNNI